MNGKSQLSIHAFFNAIMVRAAWMSIGIVLLFVLQVSSSPIPTRIVGFTRAVMSALGLQRFLS